MRKLNLLFKSFLLLCALIAGSSAWAENVTFDFKTLASEKEWTNGTAYTSVSIPPITLSAEGGGNNGKYYTSDNSWRMYNGGTLTITPADGYSISGVSSTPSQDFTINNGVASLSFTATVKFTKIVVTYASSGATPSCATPTFNGNTAFLTSTEVSLACTTNGATIQYSTNGGTSWTNYSAPFTLNETTTVKAKATKNGMTDSDEASETFTKVTPITVAQALTAINALDDGGTIPNQCVSGKVSQVDSYNSTYKSITYWISDDGSTTSQLEVYGGLGLNGAKFTAMTDLNVGDLVVVYGTLKKYVSNSNTTPEFTQNSQLLSYEATGTPTPSINASNVTIDSEATSGEITYSITNPAGASLTAAVKEGNWISNINISADKVTFSVTQNTGEQRVGYITLSYTGAADKDVKITQNATFGTASLPFAFDAGKADIEKTNGLFHKGLGGDYNYSPKLKFDDTDDYLILKINGAAEKLYFDIKGNSFSEGTFKVQTSTDGVTYSDLKAYNELGAASHESLVLASSVRYIKWIYTNKKNGNVALGRIGVNCEAAYIPSAGYATYTTPNIIDFTGTGVTAYKVSAVGDESITLVEVKKAPAGTPLVLKAATANYALNVTASADEVTGNELQVSEGGATSDDNKTVYALASKGETPKVGFYKVQAGTKVPAGKCYLSVAKEASSARDFLGFIEENATRINAVENGQSTDEVFDLQGRQVKQPTKGLYIKNGKKVIIK